MTSMRGPLRLFASIRSMQGIAKAAVFPVPVWASPRTSRPARAGGIVSAWIGRGLEYRHLRIAFASAGERFRSAKLLRGFDLGPDKGISSRSASRWQAGIGDHPHNSGRHRLAGRRDLKDPVVRAGVHPLVLRSV